MEFYLVRIFPYSDWIRTRKNYLDTFQAVKDTNIQIATQGKRNLGAAHGTSQYRDECIMGKINEWVEELHIAKSQK